MPPQRVQRMVQYSQPPRPARPGMILSTTSPPLHCGQAESTATAGSTSISDMRYSLGCSLAAQAEAVDVALGIRNRLFGIVPGKADVERGKGDAVDHDRLLIRPADPRMPQTLAGPEGFNVKAVVKAGHPPLRVPHDCHEN